MAIFNSYVKLPEGIGLSEVGQHPNKYLKHTSHFN